MGGEGSATALGKRGGVGEPPSWVTLSAGPKCRRPKYALIHILYMNIYGERFHKIYGEHIVND